MADRMTLDEMIAALQAQRDAGVPGDMLVGITERDNNGRPGVVKLDISPRLVPLARDEYAKGWALCRVVSRGGVPAIVIG